jgi:two-component system LytT family response regulator
MITAFIVDDERLAIERLRRLLAQTGRVQVAGSSTDPEEALAELRGKAIDVLFLDIQMPGLSGFDLLERLDSNVPVIFTTAYDEHALRAFAVNSIDYLLKPVEPERLDHALDKLSRLTSARPDIRTLARELSAHLAPSRRLERLASRVGERTTLIDVARISHFVAKDKLTFAVVGGREHVVDMTLAQLEEQLDPRRFVRIHRATIVNATFVHELHADVDGGGRPAHASTGDTRSEPRGGMIVRLRDEAKTELSVARDRVRELKARLGI